MSAIPANAVLLLIDVQQAFDNPVWGERNNPCAERNIAALLAHWRRLAYPVFHIQHVNPSPTSLFNRDQQGVLVKAEAMPIAGEPIFFKSVNSAFIGTDLEAQLRANGVSTLVIVGLTTDHCVSTTTRMAGNLGFAVYVVSDATATFERIGPDGRHWSAQMMHDGALTSLNHEFATVISSSEVLESISRRTTSQSLEQRKSMDSFESSMIPTLNLAEQIRREVSIPVISSRGMMDGEDIVDSFKHGAVAAQLGTAFLACHDHRSCV